MNISLFHIPEPPHLFWKGSQRPQTHKLLSTLSTASTSWINETWRNIMKKKKVKGNGKKPNPFNLHELKLLDSSGLCKQSKTTNIVWRNGFFMLLHTIIQYMFLLHNLSNYLKHINGWKHIIPSAVWCSRCEGRHSKPPWPGSCHFMWWTGEICLNTLELVERPDS